MRLISKLLILTNSVPMRFHSYNTPYRENHFINMIMKCTKLRNRIEESVRILTKTLDSFLCTLQTSCVIINTDVPVMSSSQAKPPIHLLSCLPLLI